MSKIVYPRTCSISGEGVYEGYLCHDGTIFKYEKDLVRWIRTNYSSDDDLDVGSDGIPSDLMLSDEFILKESYDNEEYCWTEWYDDDIQDDVNDIEVIVEPIEISSNENIIKFMYYANNFDHNWIDKVWSDNSHMREHLTSKWNALNSTSSVGGTMNFFKLFMQLDGQNRNKLCDWISANYKG